MVAYLAEQPKLDPKLFTRCDWTGRMIKYHREQMRAGSGFREFTHGDEDQLAGWLAEEVCPVELWNRSCDRPSKQGIALRA